MTQIPAVALYRQALERHDWYYDFSDDPYVWNLGFKARNELERQQVLLDPSGRIWNEFAPDMFKKNQNAKA